MTYKEPGLFNDWTEIVVKDARYVKNTVTVERDGALHFYSEYKLSDGDRCFFLSFDQLERLYQIAKAMRGHYGWGA